MCWISSVDQSDHINNGDLVLPMFSFIRIILNISLPLHLMKSSFPSLLFFFIGRHIEHVFEHWTTILVTQEKRRETLLLVLVVIEQLISVRNNSSTNVRMEFYRTMLDTTVTQCEQGTKKQTGRGANRVREVVSYRCIHRSARRTKAIKQKTSA